MILQGKRVKEMIHDQNDFFWPGKRFREFDADRQDRLAQRIAMKMSMPGVNDMLRDKWMDIWKKCDENLASKVESNLKSM